MIRYENRTIRQDNRTIRYENRRTTRIFILKYKQNRKMITLFNIFELSEVLYY